MKKLLLILLVCLLPIAALAHTGTSEDEVISACLETLGEDWLVCEGEDGQPLFANGGSCAVGFVTDGYYDLFVKKNFVRLLDGENALYITGDVVSVQITWQNMRYM